MTLRAELIGDCTIKMKDLEVYSALNPISALCKALINKGLEDQPLELYREDMKCLVISSIKKQSELVVGENPKLNYRKGRPTGNIYNAPSIGVGSSRNHSNAPKVLTPTLEVEGLPWAQEEV